MVIFIENDAIGRYDGDTARYGSDSAENGGADDIANLGDVTDDGEA